MLFFDENTAIYLRAVINLIVRSNLEGGEQGQGILAGNWGVSAIRRS